jgi:hypothetical protein
MFCRLFGTWNDISFPILCANCVPGSEDTQILRNGNLTHGRSAIFYSSDLNIRSLMPHGCAISVPYVESQGGNSMARKGGQIIARGAPQLALIRVYLGRDHKTQKRNYHNWTIRGAMREV